MTENLTLVSGMGRVEPGAGYCSTFPHTPVSFPAILLRFSLGYFHTGLNSLSWCHGRLYFVTLHFRDRHSVAYSRFSDSGDDALLKSTRKYECVMCEKKFLPFSFRVRAFSISRTPLSRSLEQARRSAASLRHRNRAGTTELVCE